MSPQKIAELLGLESLGVENDLDWLMRYDYRNCCALDENGAVVGLNLRGNALREADVRFLFGIETLQALNLSENELENLDLPASCRALRRLDLNRNPNLRALRMEAALPRLERLEAAECALQSLELPAGCMALHTLYLQKNKLQSLYFGGDCPALSMLDAAWNNLIRFELPPGFQALQYLYLRDNALERLELSDTLTALEILHLRANAIADFRPEWLDRLPRLEALYLHGNPLPDSMYGHIENDENASCLDYLQQQYFPDLAQGAALDDECKVLLIGNGKVGKSCFAGRLVDKKFNPVWDSTHGIVLKRLKEASLTGSYTLNLWDFGGQDMYHATHRLFMQSNAVYLVFWDWDTEHSPTTRHNEHDYDNEELDYWLAYAKSLGKGSPIIVVQTKTGDHGKKDCPQQARLRERFAPLSFEHIESKGAREKWEDEDWSENGYKSLMDKVLPAVRRSKNKAGIPLLYIRLREALRARQVADAENRSISLENYLALPEAQALKNPLDVLENWLHKTGVVFYQKDLFQGRIILDQEWAIQAVYTLFKREDNIYYEALLGRKGKFDGAFLAKKVWKDKGESECELLVNMMLSCEICFEITEKDAEHEHRSVPFVERQFIAPELLPPDRPRTVDSTWKRHKALYLRYRHDFLHYGVIQSFIVRTRRLAELDDIWKMGMQLSEGDQLALVEADKKQHTITVRVTENGKPLLDKIRNRLSELQDGEGLESVSLDGQNFFRLDQLEQRYRDAPDGEICAENNDRHYLPVKSLAIFLQWDEKTVFEEEEPANVSRKMCEDLMAAGRLRDVLEYLRQKAPRAIQSEALLLLGQLSELEQKEGRIDSRDAKTEREAIRYEAFKLMERLEESKEHRGTLDISGKRAPYSSGGPVAVMQPRIATDEKEDLKKILFIGANPKASGRLAIDEEHRKMVAELERGKHSNRYDFLPPKLSATMEETRRGLNGYPWLVHFSGHGSARGIMLATHDNREEWLELNALNYMFSTLAGHTRVVILNACYSAELAQAISKLGMYVIGHDRPIDDPAAVNFTEGFYLGLGDGRSVEQACQDGYFMVLARNPQNTHIIQVWKDGEPLRLWT